MFIQEQFDDQQQKQPKAERVILFNGDGVTYAEKYDFVAIHLKSMLLNGTVIDNTRDRDQPIIFQLNTNQTIQALEDTIPLMSKGEADRLFIPWQLAYGAQGIEGFIQPYQDIEMEIELIDIIKKDEL